MNKKVNEIKKALYKEKPKAVLTYIRKGAAYYFTSLNNGERVDFKVPIEDMGDADFQVHMDAALLIRWIIV